MALVAIHSANEDSLCFPWMSTRAIPTSHSFDIYYFNIAKHFNYSRNINF